MKSYIIISDTGRESLYLFGETSRVLASKIKRVSRLARIIYLEGYSLRFISEEKFYRDVQYGNRAKIVYGRHFERCLDTYSIRRSTAKEIKEWLKTHSDGVIAESLLNTYFKEKFDVEE